jgi:hypothetical protein
MKKIFVLAAGICMLAAGCAVQKPEPVLENNQKTEASKTEEAAAPDMSNWQTYTNAKAGFKISYPAGYKVVENPKDPTHPGALLYLENDGDNDEIYGQIYISKRRASLKQMVNEEFSLNLNKMQTVSSADMQNQYWEFNLFSGDAYMNNKHFILYDHQATRPDDAGDAVADILVARVLSSNKNGVIDETTTPDWIARTMQFTK